MNVLEQENIGCGDSGENVIDWNPSNGWHEAVIGAVADIGQFPNKFKPGTMKSMVGVYFILEESVDIQGEVVQKGHVERYTASLHEKSGAVTNLIKPAELGNITTFTQLVGKRVKFKLKKEGNYINIKLMDVAEKDVPVFENLKDTYVPKFWKVKDGVELDYYIKTMPGVINGVRPKAAPAATQPAQGVDLAQDMKIQEAAPAATTVDNYDDDIYN